MYNRNTGTPPFISKNGSGGILTRGKSNSSDDSDLQNSQPSDTTFENSTRRLSFWFSWLLMLWVALIVIVN